MPSLELLGSDEMTAEHHITLEPRTQLQRADVPLFLVGGGARSLRGQRLSQRQLLMLVLACVSGLFILYAYWDVMMLSAGAVPPAATTTTHFANETLAERLKREVRVLCWVLTTPKYHKSRAVHIQRTWGKRCNKIYFMTSEQDDELETVVLTKPDKYEVLWGKTKEAFTYIFENKLGEADWFMKADDDTYVFVENLRYMLYPYSPDMPIHFGFNYKLLGAHANNASYMSGGSGYVLSREALRQFVNGLSDGSKCRQEDNQAEDLEMGRCLYNLGIPAGDSRDDKLRYRFLPMAPFSALISHYTGMDFWFYKYAFYNPRACMDCLSEYPVAFHYINNQELYVYDYFNYEFQRHGRTKPIESLPQKIPPAQLVIPPGDNLIGT